MKIKVQRVSDIEMPFYAHKGDAAFDLRSADIGTLNPGDRKSFRTGIKMAIPEGYVGLIWDRSGLAAKNGIHVLAGVIDSGYRGEISIVLKNLGHEPIEITKNMRIAQMLIQPAFTADLEETDSLDDTDRSNGAFGSTGLH